MKHLSISQSFMLCSLNQGGHFPTLVLEIPACIVAGGIVDLILENNITLSNNKLNAVSQPNDEYQYLQSLYHFIKTMGDIPLASLAAEYFSADIYNRFNILKCEIGDSLVNKQCVSLHHGGLFRNKKLFIPNRMAVECVIQKVRTSLLEDEPLSDEMIALIRLLHKSRILNQFLSSCEQDIWKARMAEIKQPTEHSEVNELIDYTVDIMVLILNSVGGYRLLQIYSNNE